MARNPKHMDPEARKAKLAEQALAIQAGLKRIRHKILVMSGKGGVGKSSIAAYLAAALARRGRRVGLMDVDLHGPSIPRMVGLKPESRPHVQNNKMTPIDCIENLRVMSIETLNPDKDAATIWRGPLKGGAIRQFIADIDWGDLDYLIVDSPPGTGDEPLTVAQIIPDAKALVVTTPQEVSLADVRKAIHFCREVNMAILGVVENMSGLVCPHCGGRIDLFKSGGGAQTAQRAEIPFLGRLPLEPAVVIGGDAGNLMLLEDRSLEFSRAFQELVNTIERILDGGETDFPTVPQQGVNPV